MRRGALGLLAAILAVCLTVVPAAAHHVIAAKFDPNQTLTLNGTVVASQSAAQQFNPASAVKLATALVALICSSSMFTPRATVDCRDEASGASASINDDLHQ